MNTSSAVRNVIAVGNSGTGKTHIALGLGLAACQRGVSVGFTTAAALVHELMEARDERRLLNLQRQLSRLNLLIIDGTGLRAPVHHRGGIAVRGLQPALTSEAPSWSPPTSPSTSGPRSSDRSASPGRCWTGSPITSHILEMNGESYRLKRSRENAAAQAPDELDNP